MISDLSGRLYYCSDSPSGRKTRRELERAIRRLEAILSRAQEEEAIQYDMLDDIERREVVE